VIYQIYPRSFQDSNGDGVGDQADAAFADLRLWVDANSDGITDAGELHTLSEFGITSMRLGYTQTDTLDNGNLLALSSSYTTSDGQTHDMADVWFRQDTGDAGGVTDLQAADLLAAPTDSVLAATGSGAGGAEASSGGAAVADGGGAADQVMVDTAAIAAVQGLADAMLEEQQRQVLI